MFVISALLLKMWLKVFEKYILRNVHIFQYTITNEELPLDYIEVVFGKKT